MTCIVGSGKRTNRASTHDAKLALLRSATTRYGTKRTTNGNANTRPPRTPSLPRLKFLDKPEAEQ